MKVVDGHDHGKIAATLADTATGAAVRVRPQDGVRERALAYAPGERRRYFAQLLGYQRMPDEELLLIEPVRLTPSLAQLLGRPGVRACCACGKTPRSGIAKHKSHGLFGMWIWIAW